MSRRVSAARSAPPRFLKGQSPAEDAGARPTADLAALLAAGVPRLVGRLRERLTKLGSAGIQQRAGFKIEHVLVALDGSPQSRAALQAATNLAAILGADVTGVFVEDQNLIRMAELPFAREVRWFSGEPRAMAPRALKRSLRAQAARVRKELIQRAESLGLAWQFERRLGHTIEVLLARARQADIVVLGRASQRARRKVGSTAQALIRAPGSPTLILPEDAQLPARILVLYDGSSIAEHVLQAGAALAANFGQGISVLIVAPDKPSAAGLQQECAEKLRGFQLQADYRWLVSPSRGDLARALEVVGAIAVVPPLIRARETVGLTRLIDQLGCPILIVHGLPERE